LTFAECGNLQSSIDETYESMLEDITRFEDHAESFLSQLVQSAFENEAKILVQGLQEVMAGCLKWQ
jgi:hypothetical protein